MIVAAWRPRTKTVKGKTRIVYYEKVDLDKLDYSSPGSIKVIYKCDGKNCKFPDETHSIDLRHLRNAKENEDYHAKNTLELQICTSCKSSGENNGMHGRTHTEEVRNKLSEIAFKPYNEYLMKKYGVDNVSQLEEIKEKKGQTIINEENAKELCENSGLEFISLEGSNKYAKLEVRCPEGHVFTRKWIYLRAGITGCSECFRDRLRRQGLKGKKGYILYYHRVYQYTKKTVSEYPSKIENLHLRSKQWHLDHKYSICEGFKNNIPPYIIGSYHNLEIVDSMENSRKQERCSISEEELFDNYFTEEYW